jgi:hypothetical protein
MEPIPVSQDDLQNAYRHAKGNFLYLHRIMVRLGLVGEKERIQIYELTKKDK